MKFGINPNLSEEEQKKLAPLLARYREHLRINPLLGFTPHAKQRTFLTSQLPLKAFLGGNRSGKTTSGIVDDLIQAVDEDVLPEELRAYKKFTPPFYCRIVAPDFNTTMEGVIFQKIREWVPKTQLDGGEWSKAYDKQRRTLRFKNGSWFQFLTFEQDLDKHSGAALHRVHFDEEPPEPIRNECLMRLIDYGGDELFTMTPLLGMSWMYDRIYEPWTKGQLRDGLVVTVDMDDNPYLDPVTKRRALAGLSDEERVARKEGRFVHFGGMIYHEFSPTRHIVPQLDGVPEGAAVYVGLDPGYRHLAAAVYVLVDNDQNLVVFDEIGLQRTNLQDFVREIYKTNARWGLGNVMYIIDPAARNANFQTGRSDQTEFWDLGISCFPGQNAVGPGIGRVKRYLRTDKLVVAANCGGIIDEFKKYRWKSPSTRSQEEPKEEPLKTNDHRLDALRYVLMARPAFYDEPADTTPNSTRDLVHQLVEQDLASGPRSKVSTAQGGPGRFT